MNRKIFLIMILSLLSANVLSAQIKVDRDYGSPVSDKDQVVSEYRSPLVVKYGLKAGLTLSGLENKMEFDPQFRMMPGFHLGAVINLHWGQGKHAGCPGSGLWGLQPELMYSYKRTGSLGGDIILHYVQLPVLLEIYPVSGFSIELGPEFSYLVGSCRKLIDFGDNVVNLSNSRGFRFGAAAGLSYEFKFGLTLGVRYSIGFNDLDENVLWRNTHNVQISLGWLF